MLLDFLKDGLDPTYLCMMVPVTWREQVSCLHFPLLYVHCASHCLNLAVVSSLEVVAVRNMIGIVNRVSTFFFAYPKQQRKLEEAIETTQPESSVHKLKDLCRT